MSGAVTWGPNPFVAFGTESGDFVVFDVDIQRRIPIFPADPPAAIGGTQGVSWWFRGAPPRPIQVTEHWTVDTVDEHPARTRFAPPGKRPPPSGPHVLPGKPVVKKAKAGNMPPAPAPALTPVDQAKAVVDAVSSESKKPAASRSKQTGMLAADRDAVPIETPPTHNITPQPAAEPFLWILISGSVVGVLLLGLGLVLSRRRRMAVVPPASVKVRCARCGKVIRVWSGAAGKRFECPGCGERQSIAAGEP
jgi:DNA-directed RNA polymerase subunit RPC12/RpoP